VDHYGFEILYAYMNINCFNTKPSIESSVRFLKKTDWAREKVETFYLYQFKNLPNVSSEQFSRPPRERIIPADHQPGEPAELSLEEAEQMRVKIAAKAAAYNKSRGQHAGSGKRTASKSNPNKAHQGSRPSRSHQRDPSDQRENSKVDPWAAWKK
jgi:uncharacterized protein (DUF2132 family)